MSLVKRVALFAGGVVFGTAGIRALTSKDAKKAYTHVTAAALRCKDEIMKNVESVQEGCSDILCDAKQINADRAMADEAEYIEDCTAEEDGDFTEESAKA